MKVVIGPYTRWIGPYQIADALCFWAHAVKDEYGTLDKPDWVHDFGTWLATDKNGKDSWLTKVCQWIDSKKKRKIKIHIDRYDTWSMCETLGRIILPMLIQLKKDKHGAPYADDEDVPEHLRSTAAPPKDSEFDIDELHFARWEWIMDEMIWAFTQMNDEDNDAQFHSGVNDYLSQPVDHDGNVLGPAVPFNSKDKVKAPLYQIVHGPNHTAVFDHEGYRKHHDRIQNGCRLFGKYFQNLWD